MLFERTKKSTMLLVCSNE